MGATLGQHTPSSFPKGLVVCGDVNGCYSSTTDTHLPKHHVDDVDVKLNLQPTSLFIGGPTSSSAIYLCLSPSAASFSPTST